MAYFYQKTSPINFLSFNFAGIFFDNFFFVFGKGTKTLLLELTGSVYDVVVFLASGEGLERNGSSEEEADLQNNLIDPQAEDRELKGQLLRKYSGYLGSLKQEFMKKRKKGKLPKEARQQLLDWWSRHYKWPYPSVSLFFRFIVCYRSY